MTGHPHRRHWSWPVLLLLSALVMVSGIAQGVEILRQDLVRADEVIQDNVIFFGGELSVEGTIEGDLLVMSGKLNISGQVQGDVIAWCGMITSEGTIGGDARLAAGEVKLTGPVNDDVCAVAGTIEIGGPVGGDALLSGGHVRVREQVGGDLFIGAGTLDLDAQVAGDARFHVGTLLIADTTRIAHSLRYTSTQSATVPEGIAAEMIPVPVSQEQTLSRKVRILLHLAQILFQIIAFALLASLFYAIAPRSLQAVTIPIEYMPARTGLVGAAATLLVFPVIILVCLMGLLLMFFWGFLPGVALWSLAIGLSIALWAWSPLITGTWLGAKLARTPPGRLPPLRVVLLGVLGIVLLGLIPGIGVIVQIVSFIFALGGILMARFQAGYQPEPDDLLGYTDEELG